MYCSPKLDGEGHLKKTRSSQGSHNMSSGQSLVTVFSSESSHIENKRKSDDRDGIMLISLNRSNFTGDRDLGERSINRVKRHVV